MQRFCSASNLLFVFFCFSRLLLVFSLRFIASAGIFASPPPPLSSPFLCFNWATRAMLSLTHSLSPLSTVCLCLHYTRSLVLTPLARTFAGIAASSPRLAALWILIFCAFFVALFFFALLPCLLFRGAPYIFVFFGLVWFWLFGFLFTYLTPLRYGFFMWWFLLTVSLVSM